jgi:A/G-specific adenine glycosylase
MSKRTIFLQYSTISTENIRTIRKILARWGNNNYQNFPWRNTRIKWHGLVAEIFLQRTRAKNVLPVYKEFINKYKTYKTFSKASIKDLSDLIYPLGLKWRAPLLKKLSKFLFFSKGRLPREKSELIKLPAVGQYAASAWLCFHGGIRTTIIDTNVVRWICRLLNISFDGETRRQKWLINVAESLTPAVNWREYNYAVLDFTMLICTKKPCCTICPIYRFCLYENKINGT